MHVTKFYFLICYLKGLNKENLNSEMAAILTSLAKAMKA